VPELIKVRYALGGLRVVHGDFGFADANTSPKKADHHFDFKIKFASEEREVLHLKHGIDAKPALRISNLGVGLEFHPEVGEFSTKLARARDCCGIQAAIADDEIPGMLKRECDELGDL